MSNSQKKPLEGFIRLFHADAETSIALLKNSLSALEKNAISESDPEQSKEMQKTQETVDPFRLHPEFLGRLAEQFNDIVLQTIFSFCEESDFSSINIVCKNWRRIANSFDLW